MTSSACLSGTQVALRAMPGDLVYAGRARMIVIGRRRDGTILGLSFGAGAPDGGNDLLIRWYRTFRNDQLTYVSGRPSQEPSQE